MESDLVRLKVIKSALSGYITEALSMLGESEKPDEKVVHDVRVLMKKSRAVLKLVGSQFDNETVRRDIIALRSVGRLLCTTRECTVLRKTLKELRKKHPLVFEKLVDNEKLNSLIKKPDFVKESNEDIAEAKSEIKDILKKTGYRIRFQSMNNLDPTLLLRELDKSYNIVVDAYLICRNDPKREKFHNFRKKSKDFLYQLYFFRPLNSSKVKTLEEKIADMTTALGKYNDLAQLIIKLGYRYRSGSESAALDELIIKVREEQDLLLARVWPVAYKVFCPGQNLVNVLGFRLLVI
jgi:CHAD domain-containing protein